MTHRDDDLRSRFTELRATQTGRAPEFGDVLGRAPAAPRPAIGSSTLWLATAAAASIVVVALLVTDRARSAVPARQPVAAWQSPTTSLVPRTVQAVLAPAPLLSSVLDGATSSTLWHKGD